MLRAVSRAVSRTVSRAVGRAVSRAVSRTVSDLAAGSSSVVAVAVVWVTCRSRCDGSQWNSRTDLACE
ncbi:hypothetical protein [Alkalinema sp. FACHB-956]|uniref:hypothetical protein n=1 Tax=Alkalinema sp. FACHB-956 TaxID=2692768 RepID=UPI001686679D|nr:hypothetical protein [Alkalinema sp. FACHB-956]MBD2325604.1 hypothetical protein [Alkalinema sp. FACHB-956]